MSVCHGMVPSTAAVNICPALSSPWAAGKVYSPMEPLLLHLAAPLSFLTVLLPSSHLASPSLSEMFPQRHHQLHWRLSLGHRADWDQPPEGALLAGTPPLHTSPPQILPLKAHVGWLHPQIQPGKWDGRGTQGEGGVSGKQERCGGPAGAAGGKGLCVREFPTLLISKVSASVTLVTKVVSGQGWKNNSAGGNLMGIVALCCRTSCVKYLSMQLSLAGSGDRCSQTGKLRTWADLCVDLHVSEGRGLDSPQPAVCVGHSPSR